MGNVYEISNEIRNQESVVSLKLIMPASIHSSTSFQQRVVSRTINEWHDFYGMSPIEPKSIRFYDKTPPTLKYVSQKICSHSAALSKRNIVFDVGLLQMVHIVGYLTKKIRSVMTDELA